MDFMRRKVALAAIAGAMLAGGAVGATAFAASSGSGTTATTPAASSNSSNPAPPSGTFKPIETPSHEATESAQREAQENAGQIPTVP